MHRIHLRAARSALAALLLVLVFTASAHAAVGDTVYIRIEGQAQTLVPRTAVTLQPGNVPGNDGCPMTTVGGAIELATHGNWDRAPKGLVSTIAGETHDFSNSDYWAGWVNNSYGDAFCGQQLSKNDDVVLLVDVSESVKPFKSTVFLTTLEVPSSAKAGQPFSVSATYYDNQTAPDQFPSAGTGIPKPAEGVRITGPGVDVLTGADGKATVTLSSAGTAELKGSKGNSRTTGYPVCVYSGANTCDAPPPVAVSAGAVKNISNGQVFTRARAPRALSGRFQLGTFGLRAVELRLTRRVNGRCQFYSVASERFKTTKRCSPGSYYRYKVGDQGDWSYLLPSKLTAGTYSLEVTATDKLGNRATQTRRFTVR